MQREILKKIRADLGLSQVDVALKLGINVRTYERYESEKAVVPISTVELLCFHAGYTKEQIIIITDDLRGEVASKIDTIDYLEGKLITAKDDTGVRQFISIPLHAGHELTINAYDSWITGRYEATFNEDSIENARIITNDGSVIQLKELCRIRKKVKS